MLKVILVRHGESTANAEQRYVGQKDCPLTELGKMQAQRLALRLKKENLSVIYSSDLKRAKETAHIIAGKAGIERIIEEPLLREISFGEWEGLTYDEIGNKWEKLRNAWISDPLNISPPGGETLIQLQKRSVEAFLKITKKYDSGTLALVCHAGPIRCILCTLKNLPLTSFWDIAIQPSEAITIHL